MVHKTCENFRNFESVLVENLTENYPLYQGFSPFAAFFHLNPGPAEPGYTLPLQAV